MDIINLLSFGNSGWGDNFLLAVLMTVSLSILSFGLGTTIGIFVANVKINGTYFGKKIANIYTTVLRGVPEILFIYLLFFGGSNILMSVTGIFGFKGYIELPPFLIGVITIGAVSGAYSTEVFRGAILSVQKGQKEAGLALGLEKEYIFKNIILPQAIRNAIPALGNVWQLTLKDTALISITGLIEILRVAKDATSFEKEPFLFFLLAALLFLTLTAISTRLQKIIESHYNKNLANGGGSL